MTIKEKMDCVNNDFKEKEGCDYCDIVTHLVGQEIFEKTH